MDHIQDLVRLMSIILPQVLNGNLSVMEGLSGNFGLTAIFDRFRTDSFGFGLVFSLFLMFSWQAMMIACQVQSPYSRFWATSAVGSLEHVRVNKIPVRVSHGSGFELMGKSSFIFKGFRSLGILMLIFWSKANHILIVTVVVDEVSVV
ncbi:hypothetical protein PHYBLDRAFT_62232 [Phycomyces blakesleeanus NRRL 1555(-)]|uniref:Uncharacterized protein n=1 Tax=Phycomyces blakesleeanus (strain ATCC 8743b / DSM 1359 / FGSC 10004 / NBRC 33097 / NRRL 1555) TaxID=763407 RepID=A0A167Q3B4_PHYB8|nr:hypothetical protein PHYBLDRAFT_62232 [Phycomyces blakesleeanus NRRL 1555(-)]OAD78998.1 hypothetical protein PHYBLDRAFT_62232 [Phycomyces blakesleeanus NRRL 1555(-)]|eukprot:XP_018297038.1 hypothetical protein PHYBLDRAFT_62232 [Phycomyces blakesleeanus NRRL 1555(-)]